MLTVGLLITCCTTGGFGRGGNTCRFLTNMKVMTINATNTTPTGTATAGASIEMSFWWTWICARTKTNRQTGESSMVFNPCEPKTYQRKPTMEEGVPHFANDEQFVRYSNSVAWQHISYTGGLSLCKLALCIAFLLSAAIMICSPMGDPVGIETDGGDGGTRCSGARPTRTLNSLTWGKKAWSADFWKCWHELACKSSWVLKFKRTLLSYIDPLKRFRLGVELIKVANAWTLERLSESLSNTAKKTITEPWRKSLTCHNHAQHLWVSRIESTETNK